MLELLLVLIARFEVYHISYRIDRRLSHFHVDSQAYIAEARAEAEAKAKAEAEAKAKVLQGCGRTVPRLDTYGYLWARFEVYHISYRIDRRLSHFHVDSQAEAEARVRAEEERLRAEAQAKVLQGCA